MGILNTFYIMFKSNAEDVIKGNKEISRSTKETARDLENTNDKAHSLGQSFVKTVEGIATLGGAAAGFAILKNGIDDTATLNASLKVTAALGQQSVSVLKQMGQAASAAGGSMQGALSDYQGIISRYQAVGLEAPDIRSVMQATRDRIAGRSMNEKMAVLRDLGWNDQGNQMLLAHFSDADFNARVKRGGEIAPLTQAEADAAFNKVGQDADLAGAKGTWFGRAFDKIKNQYSWALNKLTGGILGASESTGGLAGGAAAIVGGSAVGAGGLAKLAGLGMGGIAATGAVGGAGLLGGMGLGGWLTEKLFKNGFFEGVLNHYGLTQQDLNDSLGGAKLTANISSGSPALDFWLKEGYSPAQAAGIMANIQHESAWDPAARGDGGRAHGLFQWHPDRRANILQNTGIDVSSAGALDQMKAAAWEMKNGRSQFSDEYFRSIGSADEAAAYFSKKFESPANGAIQAMLRGKTALGMISEFPSSFGGNQTSVKIDKIEINTQATDAAGIAKEIGQQLHSQLSYLEANYDDGVDK